MLIFWLKDAFSLFKYYRTRFIFSLVGIAVGVGAICALSAVKVVVNKNSEQLLQKYGSGRFVATIMPMSAKEQKLVEAKLSSHAVSQFCQDLLPNFQVVPYQLLNIRSTQNSKNLDAVTIATASDIFSLMQWRPIQGRVLHPLDKHDKVAMIGNQVAEKIRELSSAPEVIGKAISLGGHYFTVIGILEYVELNPLLDFDANQSIFIDLNLLNRFNANTILDSYIVEGVEQTIPESEAKFRDIIKNELGVQQVFFRDALVFQQLLFKQVMLTMKILTLVAAITLFLGILSILNLFIILIDERKKEIGLRLSLGATSSHITWQFLRESILLSSIGGISGIVFGQITAYIIVRKLEMTYYGEWKSWMVGFSCSLLVGIGAGIIPAKLAAKLHPVKLINS